MQFLDRKTAKPIDEIDHIKQSIADILTTPVGTRVMLRDYGSRVFEYVDQPVNAETIAGIIFESISAIDTWEPRIVAKRIKPEFSVAGKVTINVDFERTGETKKELHTLEIQL